MSYHNNNNI